MITKPSFAIMWPGGFESDFLDRALVEGFIELDAAVASDAPNQSTRHSRQGQKIEDNTLAALGLLV